MTFPSVSLAELRRNCANRTLEQLCLPRALPRDDLDKLDGAVPSWRLEANEFLYRGGDRLSTLFVLRAGTLMMHAESAPGSRRVHGFCLPGELVGLDGLSSGRHLATCTALEPSSASAIPSYRLEEVCALVPGLRHQLVRLMSRVVCSEHQVLLTLHHLKQDRRLALYLIDLSRRHLRQGSSSVCFRLPMSRHQLASYLGITPASVSLTFARLRDAGILSIRGSNIRLVDTARLIGLSGDAGPFRDVHPERPCSAAADAAEPDLALF